MARIELNGNKYDYATRNIYNELTEYCDKSIEKFNRKVSRRVWKNRARAKREAQKIKESKWK